MTPKQAQALIVRLEANGAQQSHITLDEMCNLSRRSKYGNVRCTMDGHTFDSQAEMQRYCELRLLERAGAIVNLQLQPRFELVAKQPGQRASFYVADFQYEEDGQTIVEDVKGGRATQTAIFRLKAKLFRQRYPDLELRIIER
jgi:hypothetical protein